jgi:hypothetical protein
VLKLLVPTETRVQKTLVSNKNRTMHNPFYAIGDHVVIILMSYLGREIKLRTPQS